MTFRRSDLQEAFFVPGAHAFRVLGYSTADPLDEVLRPGYFRAAGGLLRPGDLIYLGTGAATGRRRQGGGAGPARMALLMVRNGAPGQVSIRVVQDFGRTDDRAALEPLRPALPPAASAISELPAVRTDDSDAFQVLQPALSPAAIPEAPVEAAQPARSPARSALAQAPAAALEAAPAKRGRGRPPGSRNKKNGALTTTALN